ncbi:glycosyl hydrolase, partial [Bacteroidota bacterium]
TEEAITRDLETMKSNFINRATIWDINDNKYGTTELGGFYSIPPGPAFLSDESVELIRHTLAEGKRLNMSIGIMGASGWNFGGSWVTPDWASKALYFSEIKVEGPKTTEIDLPFPKVTEKCPKTDDGLPVFYKEVAVLAFPFNENKTIENTDQVINLSSNYVNGELSWDVPSGKWAVLRYICSNTGQRLIAESPNSDGLYVDFLDPEAIKRHLQYMLEKIGINTKNTSDHGLDYISEDSIEELSRQLLWTDLMPEIFNKQQGYSIIKFLPVFAGWDIKGKTDRFLYDFKKTCSDQFIYSHYEAGSEFLKQYSIDQVAENIWSRNVYIDDIKSMKDVPIPKGTYWLTNPSNLENFSSSRHTSSSVKKASSSAHIYGKKLVDAELYTSWRHGKDSPFNLKKSVDMVYCEGLNNPTLNNFNSTPPEEGLPGRMCYAGININDANTWWEKSKPYMTYISRCNYMLRQGLFVADVCYFYGDQTRYSKPREVNPEHHGLGKGYDFDYVSSDVIMERMSVQDGKITLPDGMTYEVMLLPEQDHMPLNVLQKIEKLVKNGAIIIGPKPTMVPGLNNFEKEEIELNRIASELWGEIDGEKVFENTYGEGKVYFGLTADEVLNRKGIVKEFSFSGQPELDYIHRTVDNGEIYFISNRNNEGYSGECVFNVQGQYPELWDPATGVQQRIQNFDTQNNNTSFQLELAPWGSVFVVFVNEERTNLEAVTTKEIVKAEEIRGSWDVTFPEGWGAPPKAVFNELKSWTNFEDKGIKYFSGTAAYHKTITIENEMIDKNTNIVLDLGDMRDVAEVYVNGKSAGIIWKMPYSIEITKLIKPGENALKIEIVNCWINRLTGDMLSDPEDRYCRCTQPYNKTITRREDEVYHLQTSGLLGPVRLLYG